MSTNRKPVIGLALGSGSARGWTHIGIIEALHELGIRPDVVAGTSIGALVGAVYVSDQLADFKEWVLRLTSRDVFSLMDLTLSGGFVKGERLFGQFAERHKNPDIEEVAQRYISVCTEMSSGREIWITKGPIISAARASCAIPGIFSPIKHDERWVLDGGLVNPVPVSACRAMGADVVIAVNLNAQLVGRHFSRADQRVMERESASQAEPNLWNRMVAALSSGDDDRPSMFDTMAASVNILQDRLTRSRMAGDPPEVTLRPILTDFALMDFHRAAEAIEEGRRCVMERRIAICSWAGVSLDQAAGDDVPVNPSDAEQIAESDD
tara:strand:+ start:3415 stop:4383 length:969 start_codon:yes stop_codon:yes gene_type:complete